MMTPYGTRDCVAAASLSRNDHKRTTRRLKRTARQAARQEIAAQKPQ